MSSWQIAQESARWQARAEAAERRLLMLATTAKSAVIVLDGSQNLTGSQAAAIDALRRRVEEVGE